MGGMGVIPAIEGAAGQEGFTAKTLQSAGDWFHATRMERFRPDPDVAGPGLSMAFEGAVEGDPSKIAEGLNRQFHPRRLGAAQPLRYGFRAATAKNAVFATLNS